MPVRASEAEHRCVAVAVDRLEEPGQLARRPHRHLRCSGPGGGQRRGARQAGDVAGHEAGALGVVEQLVERGVDVVHRAHRQAATAAAARRAAARRTARRDQRPGAPATACRRAGAARGSRHRGGSRQRRRLAALVGQAVEPRLDELGQRRPARGDEAAALVGGEEAGQLVLRLPLGAERPLRAAAGDRPPATSRARPTTTRRPASSGGRSCRWPRPNRTPDALPRGYHEAVPGTVLGRCAVTSRLPGLSWCPRQDSNLRRTV